MKGWKAAGDTEKNLLQKYLAVTIKIPIRMQKRAEAKKRWGMPVYIISIDIPQHKPARIDIIFGENHDYCKKIWR